MTQITRDQHYVPAFYFKRFFMDRRHLLALTPDILIETEECLPRIWRKDSFVSLFHNVDGKIVKRTQRVIVSPIRV